MQTDTSQPESEASPERANTDRANTDLGPLPRVLRPFVDWVAGVNASVHAKLLAGFLVIALLLLSMGVLSIAVLARVNDQVDTLTILNRQTNQARDMIYDVTSQSHYRAMALVTRDASWNDKIVGAKADFSRNLEELRSYAIPDRTAFFERLEFVNDEYARSGDEVTRLYEAR